MKQLSTRTKMLYGFGFSAQGIKDGLFQLFLFFYFSQILGLDATLAGTASIIALLFDAISDPFVGIVSDKWQSKKWGRRHPFMFASAIPLGLFIYLLFLPPEGLDQMGLFWWFTIFTILVRLALTLFLVPGMSLGAELTTDYEERTSVTAFRVMFAALVGPIIIISGLVFFFVPEEGMSNGLFNEAAYPKFAFVCGILIIISILISTWGTRDTIPNLPQASEEQNRIPLPQLLKYLREAIKMKSFWSLLASTMIIYAAIGVGTVLTTYFTTYYFGLSEKELALLPIATALGAILALFLAPYLGRKLDKKWAAFWSTIIFAIFFSLPFNLRLLGLFPENGSPNLLPLYILIILIAYLFLWVNFSITNSMLADVVDEYELKTNNRQEAVFFSSFSFAYKCTVGLGHFIAGLLLTWISFPKQAELADIPAESIHGLGIVGGPILMVFYLCSIGFILLYPISKDRYLEIREGLQNKV